MMTTTETKQPVKTATATAAAVHLTPHNLILCPPLWTYP